MERLVFSQKILGSLLGAGLVRPYHVYHVDLEEIDEVGQLIDIFRPGKLSTFKKREEKKKNNLFLSLAHRKHKRLAPVCHVIVCPDCTLLPAPTSGVEPVFCVELKPKQGFLSQGHQHCPFCLNQFLKVPFSLLAKYGTLSRDGNNRERAWRLFFIPSLLL